MRSLKSAALRFFRRYNPRPNPPQQHSPRHSPDGLLSLFWVRQTVQALRRIVMGFLTGA